MDKLLEQINTDKKINLGSVCYYVADKIDVSELSLDNYISTENMISERGGVEQASKLPIIGKVTEFKIGDTLTSNIRPYFKKIWKATKGGGCSNDVIVFRPNNENELDKVFLYYALSENRFFAYSMLTSHGTKMPRGDKDGIMKYEISLPDLPTQKKIAEILNAYDSKIENNNKIIKNLEATAQTIFNEWFINFRFPGYKSVKFVDSEIGEIPEGWKVGNLEIICERLPSGKTYREDELLNMGSIPVYDQSSKGIIGFHNEESDFKASLENPFLIFGDHTCRTQIICNPFSLGPNTIPIASKNSYSSIFSFFLIKDLIKQREYKRHWNELISNRLIIPPIGLVKRWAGLISPFINSMILSEKEDVSLRSQRDQLLTKLI